jgi:hypothetical protein
MTREDRCSYRVEAGSSERARGAGAAAPQAAAERGIGVQRVEAVPVPTPLCRFVTTGLAADSSGVAGIGAV